MTSFDHDLAFLDAQMPELEAKRFDDAISNDVFEAAWYWRDLGRWMRDGNTKVDYPARAIEELGLLKQLRDLCADRPQNHCQQFQPVFEAAAAILAVVEAWRPSKSGHLGFLRVVREQFAFLIETYGFAVVQEQPSSIRLLAGRVFVSLEISEDPEFSCEFGTEAKPDLTFSLQDLLFMKATEPFEQFDEATILETEADVERWFSSVAMLLRRFGVEVLTDAPGVFDALAAAQTRRDEEYTARLNAAILL